MRTSTMMYVIAATFTFAITGAAKAGFTGIQIDGLPNDPNCYGQPIIGADGNALVTITSPSADIGSYVVSGTLDSDPTVYGEQVITNSSTDTWDGYTVTITPITGWTLTGLTVLAPAFLSDVLPLKDVTLSADGSHAEIYYHGGLVAPGQVLETHFTFDVTASTGDFGYTVINTVHVYTTPEPATFGALGVGASLLLRRRRKSQEAYHKK
jgi:hypothetical protein